MWKFYCREILLSWRRLLLLPTENRLGLFLATVEIRFGLFCLRWKIGLALSCLWFPLVRKLDLVFSAYSSSSVGKNRRIVSKKTSIVSIKDASNISSDLSLCSVSVSIFLGWPLQEEITPKGSEFQNETLHRNFDMIWNEMSPKNWSPIQLSKNVSPAHFKIVHPQFQTQAKIRADFWEGDATKHFRHRVNGVGHRGGQAVFNQTLTRFHGIRLKSGY